MKVSLRERYKQADLEGTALRQVYRGAASYLITLAHEERCRVADKIASVDVAGLSGCVLADEPEFTELLNQLKPQSFQYAEPVMPLAGRVFPALSQ